MSTKAITGCDQCGWTSKPTTPGLADRSYRLHSCEKKRRRDADSARSRARDAAVDRTPKPCAHPRARHTHGTYAAYVLDLCRCLPCAAANSNYETDRQRRHAYGRSPLVNAAPARAHVRALGAGGMGWKRVAAQAGISGGSMTKLLYGDTRSGRGPSARVRRETATRILAVQLDLADGAPVGVTGSTRRVQALVYAGWSQQRLAARLGVTPPNFTALAHGRGQVTLATARAVTALFEELWDTPPPIATRWEQAGVTRARAYATARGWAPVMVWDEDTIDDPTAAPATGDLPDDVDPVAVLRRAHGDRTVDLTRAERLALIRDLNGAGLNDRQIGDRTGLNPDVVARDRRHLGLPPIAVPESITLRRRPLRATTPTPLREANIA